MLLYKITRRFSKIQRSQKFKLLNQNDIQYFRSILPQKQVLVDNFQTDPFNRSLQKKYLGHSNLVLKPSQTHQVSSILKYCNDNMIAVVPQGGNTGLVGGNVSVFDEIILSLKNFNKIESFDLVSGVLSCQSGCVLQKINQFLQQYGYEIPLDLGAKGSCHIGGNASTNAGGKYFIKHGPFRANILGLQTVLADGTILDMRSKIRKDNTGYDLKQLFIGSQGTLGVITKLDINCVKIDKFKQVMLLKTKNYKNIIDATEIAKGIFNKNLNAIQYMDGYAYKAITTHLYPSVMNVNSDDHLLLLEISTDDIQPFLNQIKQFDESIVSTNDKQYNSIWKIRQHIALAAQKIGIVHKYDISFDIKQWNNLILKTRKEIGGYVMGYGHVGDNNLHLNICLQQGKSFDQIKIFEQVVKRKGSISAQHGIGVHKTQYLKLQKPKQVLDICMNIKNMFDKNGILNPYKVHVQ